MPVAASSVRAAASPNDHDTAAGAHPPSPLARPGVRPQGDADMLDADLLAAERPVVGYLSAVAAAVAERGIEVATLHPDGLGRPGWARNGPGPGLSCGGTLALRPAGPGPGRGWRPTQLDWYPDTGWSARWCRGINGHLIIWRYLHAAPVPAPVVVAGFVAALAAGRDVGMTGPARAPNRGTVRTRLGRFTVPQPR